MGWSLRMIAKSVGRSLEGVVNLGKLFHYLIRSAKGSASFQIVSI